MQISFVIATISQKEQDLYQHLLLPLGSAAHFTGLSESGLICQPSFSRFTDNKSNKIV